MIPPKRAHSLDAGIDFFVPSDFNVTRVSPGNGIKIPSGIKANIPHGHALVAFNKSGICTTLGLIAGACVIDSGYQGEIHIHLINVSKKEVWITADTKIIQFLLLPISDIETEETNIGDLFIEESERNVRGFGSTSMGAAWASNQ